MKKRYHYTLCGLQNVYLMNGYTISHTNYGDAVSVQNVDNLHKTIAETLINKPMRLLPQEFKFLRKEMKLTQSMLAQIFNVSDQTVARIEKGETGADTPYEALFRAYANEVISKKRAEIVAVINEMNVQNDAKNHEIMLQLTENKWRFQVA